MATVASPFQKALQSAFGEIGPIISAVFQGELIRHKKRQHHAVLPF
jgi:hypothetical protein